MNTLCSLTIAVLESAASSAAALAGPDVMTSQTCPVVTSSAIDAEFMRFSDAWARRSPGSGTIRAFLKNAPKARIDGGLTEIDGRTASRVGTWTVTLRDPATAATRQGRGRYTFIYRFRDGVWKIDDVHSSAMPQSVGAAVNPLIASGASPHLTRFHGRGYGAQSCVLAPGGIHGGLHDLRPGRRSALAKRVNPSRHPGRQQAIMPVVARFLGLKVGMAGGLDTDPFGTFGAEVKPVGTPFDAVPGKIAAGFAFAPGAVGFGERRRFRIASPASAPAHGGRRIDRSRFRG